MTESAATSAAALAESAVSFLEVSDHQSFDGICQATHEYALMERSLFGYRASPSCTIIQICAVRIRRHVPLGEQNDNRTSVLCHA
jgi:hypothetical protein